MKDIATYLVFLAAVALATGCASSGPKYSVFSKTLPPISPEQGRIIVYRPYEFVVAGLLPAVELNGKTIGDSRFGGFFYVDRPPGQYEMSTHIFMQYSLSLRLEKGQTCFVRLEASTIPGFKRKAVPVLVDPAVGEKEIQDCVYSGSTPPKP